MKRTVAALRITLAAVATSAAVCAAAVVSSPGAAAHGGDITLEIGSSVSGTTVTYNVHLIWDDGHDVVGQGVVVDASGPGGNRSTNLPSTNSSGRTSGSLALGNGSWTVTFTTDGGSRTIAQQIGSAPPTNPPPTIPAPTSPPATSPPGKPAPSPTTSTRRSVAPNTTVAAGASTTSTIAPAVVPPVSAPVTETPTPTEPPVTSTSSPAPSSTSVERVTPIATRSDDPGSGSSSGPIMVGVLVAVMAVGGVFTVRRRRNGRRTPDEEDPAAG